MNCLKTTFSPFLATGDLGLGLTPGELYYRSDQKMTGADSSCKHLVGVPHRRTADGRLELQVCGGTPYAGKYLLAQPSTKPDQWVAELPCGLPSVITFTLTPGGHNGFYYGSTPLDYSCFAGAYTLPLTPSEAWGPCYYNDSGDTPLPTGCQRVRRVGEAWVTETTWGYIKNEQQHAGVVASFEPFAGTLRVGFAGGTSLFYTPDSYHYPDAPRAVFCGTVLPPQPASTDWWFHVGFSLLSDGTDWPGDWPIFEWDQEYAIHSHAGGYSNYQWTVRFSQ